MLIPDRLFRPGISQVGADRASVTRCRRSLPLAVGRCCCCHRCCQLGADRRVASRPPLDAISRRALAAGAAASAATPRYTGPGNQAAIPDDTGADQPYPGHGQQHPDAILRRALSAAPAEGIPVSDLITVTGMSRRWVFYRLRQLAADGYAVQTVRGHSRTE